MTPGEKLAELILGHLKEVGDAGWGRGWREHVNRTLGMSGNFLYQAMHRGNMKVHTLFDVLSALGVDSIPFLGEALAVGSAWNPLARLRNQACFLEPEVPDVLRVVKSALDDLDVLPTGPLLPEEQELIEAVEVGRFEDPRGACHLAEIAMEGIAKGNGVYSQRITIPLLAAWASARRKCDDPDSALWALLVCLKTTEKFSEFAQLGDLYQRLALCYSNHFSDYEGALAITHQALAEHCTAGNSAGAARALVDRGVWLFYLGSYQHSIEAHHRALESLPAAEINHRYTCFECVANAYRALGRPALMHRAIRQAETLVGRAGRLHTITLRWLQGSVAAEARQFEVAERAFHECCELYVEHSPVNASLVTLELVNLYLCHGRTQEAHGTATAMFRFIEPLERYPLASAAITELVAQASFARLTEDLLMVTQGEIMRARVPRSTRALAEG